MPEKPSKKRIDVQIQQFVALEAGRQRGDAVVVLVEPDLIFVGHAAPAAIQIPSALHRQALDQQPGGDLVVGCEHQRGVELFALQHVVLHHLAESFQLLATVATQRHHALVGLLTGKAAPGVQRDRAATQIVTVDHVAQAGSGVDGADYRRRRAQ